MVRCRVRTLLHFDYYYLQYFLFAIKMNPSTTQSLITSQSTIPFLACNYLKNKSNISYTSSNSKIKNFYKDVCAHLLDEMNPPQEQWLSKNTKFQYIFLPLIQKFQERQQQEFLCSRAFQSSEQKFFQGKFHHYTVFKCYKCGLEENSICCIQCFDFAKHKGHHYQLIEIKGGCCDCGDDSKWDTNGFCYKHTIDSELDQTQNEVQREFFESFCQHAFKILCKLYQAYKSKEFQILRLSLQNGANEKQQLSILKNQRKIADYALKIVDVFGYNFLKSLIIINKNRYEINQMTRQWLQQTLVFQKEMKFIRAMPTKQILLRFSQLKHIGKACVELYLILFNRAQKFRKEATISYFKLFAQLPTYIKSSYSDFSAQIFSSSNLVFELISNKEIKPLTFKKFIEHSKQRNLQAEIKSISDDYKSFLRDLNYLIQLKEDSFKAYWNYFSQQFGFQSILTFQEVFNETEDILKLSYKHSFNLQDLGLSQAIKVIDKMNGNGEFIILNLKRLTLRLFERYYFNQKPRFGEGNLFFTEQRMWAVFLFAYFYCFKGKLNCEDLGKEEINQLLKDIKASKKGPVEMNQRLADQSINLSSLSKMMGELLEQLLKRFFHMSEIMKNNSIIKQNMSFAITYYKSNNLIYCVDSFLLKFILTVQDKVQKQTVNKHLIRMIDNTYFQKFNQQFNNHFAAFRRIRRNQLQKRNLMVLFQNLILSFHNFLHLIFECVYFNYHELVLLSKFKNLLKTDRHEKKFLSFYGNILDIWGQKERKESLTDFKISFQYLFFKEDHFFQKFVNNYDQRAEDIRNKKIKEEPINLEYFYLLRFKFNSSDYLSKFVRKITFTYIPFNIKCTKRLNLISSTKHLALVKGWLQQSMRMDDFQKHLINDLTKQLFKIQVLSQASPYHMYFVKDYNQLFDQSVQDSNSLSKSSVYSFLNEDIMYDLKTYKQKNIVQRQGREQSSQSQNISYLSQAREQQMSNQYLLGRPQNYQSEGRQNRRIRNPISFQISLGLEIEKNCLLGSDCHAKNLSNTQLYQICFINLTNMYGAFQIDKYQKIMSFSTCGHLIHKICYEKQVMNGSKILKCKKCKKNYNFIISSLDYFNQAFSQDKKKLIKQDMKSILEFAQVYKTVKSVHIEVFKSTVAFLFCNVIIDDFNLLRKGLLLYKNLFKKLKFLVQEQGNNARLLSYEKNLKIPSNSPDIEFVDFVTERLAYEFRSSNYNDLSQLEHYKKHPKSVAYIVDIISFFNLETKKWTIRQPSEYVIEQPTHKINLANFPSCLTSLHQNRQCWKCRSKQRHSYYICLSHASNLKENNQFCVCFMCVGKWVQEHLKHKDEKDHLNQALMIRTDTGQIYYFFIEESQKNKIMSHAMDSIYLNSFMNYYEVSKNYKMDSFHLSKERAKNVINWLRSWNYLLLINPI